MTDPGYYDQSIPPALLLGSRRRVAGGAPAGVQVDGTLDAGGQKLGAPAVDQLASPLLVLAGAPGQYQPAVKAVDRPRNVTELNSSGAQPDPVAPWTAGQYVSVGTSGKRAHWAGQEWRGGESPGYPDAPVQNEQPAGGLTIPQGPPLGSTTPPEEPASSSTPRHAAPTELPPAPYRGTQFPGDEQPGDLTR